MTDVTEPINWEQAARRQMQSQVEIDIDTLANRHLREYARALKEGDPEEIERAGKKALRELDRLHARIGYQLEDLDLDVPASADPENVRSHLELEP